MSSGGGGRWVLGALAMGMLLVTAGGGARAQGVTRIRDIQGDCHASPMVGMRVDGVTGIVTVVRRNAVYVQDPVPDQRPSTSEAIRVAVAEDEAAEFEVGDRVVLAGEVREVLPPDPICCPVTQLGDAVITVQSHGNALPEPVVVGVGGRVPPAEVIDDDGNRECNPTTDGLDFWESLEHMRVRVHEPRVVGASKEGDVVVVGDDGRRASGLSARGALTISSEDFNPERIFVDPLQQNLPRLWVGDRLGAFVEGGGYARGRSLGADGDEAARDRGWT